MGVPGFFIWLAKRYPKIITDAFEKGVLPQDPNAIQFELEENEDFDDPYKVSGIDNLYLDMNGIIHPCCHPVDGPQPKSEEEMFKNVEVYVNKLIRIVKPQKLIYFAIDGVAPRAKMNQQRSRRFRSALESIQREEKEERLREEWQERGLKEPPIGAFKSTFDSNVITPGTQFMHRLSISLQRFIAKSLAQDQNWKGLKIIFSDAQVPGEGEHKLLEFIRSQRAQPNYNANLRHCIYGADADLIMLALSTHEAHFFIIREVFLRAAEKECSICKRKGHLYFECERSQGIQEDQFSTVLFQYIQISILRQYIEREFSRIDVSFEFDLERTIDDIVLLLFLCGNDFLPHLPSLRIAEGAIDALFFVYKYLLPKLGGYLTKNGDINLARMVYFLKHMGQVEEDIFKERLYRDDKYRDKRRFYRQRDRDQLVHSSIMQGVPGNHEQPEAVLKEAFYINVESELKKTENDDENEAILTKMFEQRLKDSLKGESEEISANYEDQVRLGAAGWKERYYFDKFGL